MSCISMKEIANIWKDIENKILNRGFEKESNYEFKKLNWTIRYDSCFIEAFNDKFYHSAEITKVEIDSLLDDIEDFIEDK